jgi:hypothetical protein
MTEPPGRVREVRLSQVAALAKAGVRRTAKAQIGSDAFIASEYIRCAMGLCPLVALTCQA